jgi:hypothetical protein
MTLSVEAKLDRLTDMMIGLADYQNKERELAVIKSNAATGHTSQTLHGTGGLWSTMGGESEIVSTHVKPRGIGTVLPSFPSNSEVPKFGFLTGISDDIGDEPTDICADAPTGYIKGGYITAQFGRVFRDTETIDIGESIRKINRGETMDLELYGAILSEAGGVLFPQMDPTGVLDVVTKAQMVVAATLMERVFARMVWNGTPASNIEPAYREFPGLDNQITTGHVDVDTNTALPSADSTIMDANYGNLDAGLDIVGLMQEVEYHVSTLAEDTVGELEGFITMRPQVWKHLTEVWPCQYNTGQCATAVQGDASRLVIDGRENISERDNMRRNMVIQINGKDYPVILDVGIVESTNADDAANHDPGEYSSSIYFVPTRISGNLPVCYWQFLDFRLGAGDIALLNNMATFWTDDGRFLWSYDSVHSCFKLKMRSEPRIVLRTPQLAWRIDNVLIAPALHNREFHPDHAHWTDGGISLRDAPTKNAAWL